MEDDTPSIERNDIAMVALIGTFSILLGATLFYTDAARSDYCSQADLFIEDLDVHINSSMLSVTVRNTGNVTLYDLRMDDFMNESYPTKELMDKLEPGETKTAVLEDTYITDKNRVFPAMCPDVLDHRPTVGWAHQPPNTTS